MYAMFTTILALDFLLQTTIVDPAVLKDGDAPGDAVVRGLCRILPIVLPRYSDAESRYHDHWNPIGKTKSSLFFSYYLLDLKIHIISRLND